MPVYSKVLVPYDYKKEYKISNNTSWAYTGSFWLRASGENLVDKSNSNLPLTSTGTGNFDNVHGPSVRFPFKGLNFNTKYYNIPISYKMTASLSIVFSGWVYLDADPNTNNSGQPIISNGISSGAQDGYSIFIDTEGRLNVRLAEAAPSNATDTNCQVLDRRTVVGHFKQSKKWHHFAVVIAPHSAVGDYQANVSIYYNGNKVTTQNGLTGANPTYNSTNVGIDIGYGYAEDFDSGESKIYLNGTLADIAMFKFDSTVTDAQMETLYNSSKNGVNQLQSGFLNVSPRRMIRDLDSRDSHPTISRNSLDGRLGNHSIFFDDSNASDPAPSSQVNFPSALPEESALLTTINSPFKNGELRTAAGNVSFDSHNMFHDRNDQPAYQPFIESKVYVETNSGFYQTGTLESVLPGFSGSLRNKETIVMEFENSASVTLGNSTVDGEHYDLTQRTDFMAYWNNSNSAFDVKPGFYCHLGSHSETAVQNFNGNLTGSCAAFTNPGLMFSSSHVDPAYASPADNEITLHALPNSYYKSLVNPISNYGFPDDRRYDSANNSTIAMSDYISKPFLLEKIVFEVPGIKLVTNGTSGGSVPTIHFPITYENGGSERIKLEALATRLQTFHVFLMREYDCKVSSLYELEFAGDSPGATNDLTNFITQSISGDRNRDVVAFGSTLIAQASETETYYSSSYASVPSDLKNIYHWVREKTGFDQHISSVPPSGFVATDAEYDADILIKTTPKIIYKTKFTGTRRSGGAKGTGHGATSSSTTQHIHRWVGGPNNITEINSSRMIGAAVSGTGEREGEFTILRPQTANGNGVSVSPYCKAVVKSVIAQTGSMYLLKPKDKLVLGIQKLLSNASSYDAQQEQHLRIPAGTQLKITMFGSYVQNEKPIQNSLNQNLNNHVVHESIGAEPVLDQFDTEYLGAFTGSFVDDNYSGTSTGPLYGTTTATDNIGGFLDRKLESRTTEGTQGISGSMKRTMRLVSGVDRIYDSMLPSVGNIIEVDEFTGLSNSQLTNLQNSGYVIYGDHSNGWNNKSYFFPFEKRYAAVPRTDQLTYKGNSIEIGEKSGIFYRDNTLPGPSAIGYVGQSPPSVVRLANKFGTLSISAAAGDSWWYTDPYKQTTNEFQSLIYGIGDGHRGVFAYHNDNQASEAAKPIFTMLRGYKYGIYNTSPAFRSVTFRRDMYGQFRDMLEQSLYTTSFTRIQLGGIGPQIRVLERPIDVRFVTQAGIPQTNRSNTSCSNLSTYATSSVPFFDRDNDNIMNLDTNGNSSGQVNRGEISIQTIDIDRNFQVGVGPFESI